MGDSITEWHCDSTSQGGWRGFLGTSLSTAGVSFDFVGPKFSCGGHAGYSGWTAAALGSISDEACAAHQPNIILLVAGTNDLFFNQPGYPQGGNATVTAARLSSLIGQIFAVLPTATVLLSGVTQINATRCANYSSAPWHPPNCPASMPSEIQELNSLLPSVVAMWKSKGHSIAFHDPNESCNFVADDYFTWGIHFSESGNQKLAAAWFKSLVPTLQSRLSSEFIA